MLITCPECQFARNINADSIPPKAQLATCPRCQAKFRFRVLPDEEAHAEEDSNDAAQSQEQILSEQKPAAENVSKETVDDVLAAVAQAEAEEHITAEASSLEVADEEEHTESISEKVSISSDVETEKADSEPEVQEESVRTVEDEPSNVAEQEEEIAAEDAVTQASAEVVEGDSQVVQYAEDVEPDEVAEQLDVSEDTFSSEDLGEPADEEQQVIPTRRSASAQALRDRQVSVRVETLESEEEAVQRYAEEQNFDGKEAVSSHIVTEADSGNADIWDAIAAMGEEPECVESFTPGCAAAQQHVIPWEDARLGSASRVVGTVGGMFAHPVSFWRGINSKAGILPSLIFFALTCAVAVFAIIGWSEVISMYWDQIIGVMQPLLAQQGMNVPALVLPALATPSIIAAVLVLLVTPFVAGALIHGIAKMLGGRNVPYSIGVKSVAYSSGAFVWLLLPVLGVCLSALYLGILFVQSVRTGYNLSLQKSVVIVFIVLSLVAAGVGSTVLAGVPLM